MRCKRMMRGVLNAVGLLGLIYEFGELTLHHQGSAYSSRSGKSVSNLPSESNFE